MKNLSFMIRTSDIGIRSVYSLQFFGSGCGARPAVTVMLAMAGDVHPNPGHRNADIFPCGFYQIPVSWSNSGIACEECEVWYHRSYACCCVVINPSSHDFREKPQLTHMLWR